MADIDSLRPHAPTALELLVRVLWIDGRIPTHQVDAVVALAEVLGESEAIARMIVRRQQERASVVPWAPGELDARTAGAIHAAAAWVVHVDGQPHANERLLLDQIAEALGLSDGDVSRLERLARNVAALPGGPRVCHAEALLYAALRFSGPAAQHAA